MSAAVAMRRLLMQAASDGYLRMFDVQLAGRIADLEPAADARLLLATALCSYGVGRGDTCLSLSGCTQFEFFTAESEKSRLELARDAGLPVTDSQIRPPPAQAWRQYLRGCEVVGEAGELTPLILHGDDHLYLGRYFELEQRLIHRLQHFIARDSDLLARTKLTQVDDNNGTEPDQLPENHRLQKLANTLKQIFRTGAGAESNKAIDWQCIAAAVGSTTPLSIITGGPGTGKTYTVAALLACLAQQHEAAHRPRIALAAPTGKAATRLTESIRNACDTLPISDEVKNYLNIEARTLHRLLSIVPGRVTPRYHQGRRLPFDVVIVDEASMVDLPLMARLFDALLDDARIVLLGDKDQLSSVESGMVLGDICGDRSVTEFSSPLARAIELLTGYRVNQSGSSTPDARTVANSIVYLRRSYRSQDGGGISALASAINDGNVTASLQCLRNKDYENIALLEPAGLNGLLKSEVLPHYENLSKLTPAGPGEIQQSLQVLGNVSVLCALRQGAFGAAGINETLRRLLNAGRHPADGDVHYSGRPLMIRENSAAMRLYNGDTGLVLPATTDDGETLLRVYFGGTERVNDKGVTVSHRSFATARLPAHETAYAMTIHKSQGSEFNTVIVVLPEEDSPLLSRELLYTAVTRAKKKIIVVASEAILRLAIGRRAVRQSGLREALWPPQEASLEIQQTTTSTQVAKARSPKNKKTADSKPEQGSFDF